MTTSPHVTSHVFGTCFLVGMLFDEPEADDSSTPQNPNGVEAYRTSTAGIELTSKRLQHDHHQEIPYVLQAKITYSTLYSFSFTFSDDIYREIVYDTTSEEEKVKIHLEGLTEFFELKYMIIKEKNIITLLKHFTKRNQTLMELSKQQIAPGAFYATGSTSKSDKHKVFESFSRQEKAFHHFDVILNEDEDKDKDHSSGDTCTSRRVKVKVKVNNPIKLFTFESLMTGKRQFLVADMESFMLRYLSLEGPKRHCYEIIREDFPCRLYFDLEYSIPANPEINGGLL